MNTLNQTDTEYFSKLVSRFRAYSKPTDAQKLLVVFYDKADKTKEDFKKIKALLNAERQAEIYFKQQQEVEKLLNAEKDKERKELEHKKFTLGGALLKAVVAGASVSNIHYSQILQDLAKQGFLSEKDKALFNDFLQAPAPAPSSPAPQNSLNSLGGSNAT